MLLKDYTVFKKTFILLDVCSSNDHLVQIPNFFLGPGN